MIRSILMLCVANSARSQLAEGLARQILGPDYHIQSAGSRPSFVHPLARAVLTEEGIDSRQHSSKAISSLDLSTVDLVITLCAEEICPLTPGRIRHIHWPLPDPAVPAESEAAQLQAFRQVRDQLRTQLEKLKPQLATHWPESGVSR
jgi:arsenate reductase